MKKVRIIPTLLFNGSSLVKGKCFNSWRIVGSIYQSVKLYSLREVDELIFLDINATKNKKIELRLIDDFADNCFMPLTIGGGIKDIEDIRELLKVGADKVSINSAAITDKKLIKEAIKIFGNQCIIISVDYKKNDKGYKKVYINSQKKITDIDLFDYLEEIKKIKPGEIMLTSVDHDGMMEGYDIETIYKVNKNIDIPVIASGGAGSYEDMYQLIKKTNVSALAAASIYHFKELTPLGVKKFLRDKNIKVRI